MTSYKEPHFSYTEATLRREVHTDNSHWELMYKAMLAQLMTYVDASVIRALAERGVDQLRPTGTQAGRGGAQPYETSRPASAEAAQGHRYDPSMNSPFGGLPIPPWLQPFTLPEQVRFTRTPDALLRHAPAAHASDMPADDPGVEADDAVPIWKKPVVLPANVRFNRTPYPRPFGNESEPEGIEAQTFTDETALPLAEAPHRPAPSSNAGQPCLVDLESGLPAWFGMVQGALPATADVAHELAIHTDGLIIDGGQVDHHDAEDLASAWLQAHEKTMAEKALRLTADQSLVDVLAAVEAVALDPEASMNPYGDSRLWATAPDRSRSRFRPRSTRSVTPRSGSKAWPSRDVARLWSPVLALPHPHLSMSSHSTPSASPGSTSVPPLPRSRRP